MKTSDLICIHRSKQVELVLRTQSDQVLKLGLTQRIRF